MLDDNDKRWISEQLEAMETRLLTAFHNWASPVEMRQRRHRDTIHDLEVGFDDLAARVKALEEKPNAKA